MSSPCSTTIKRTQLQLLLQFLPSFMLMLNLTHATHYYYRNKNMRSSSSSSSSSIIIPAYASPSSSSNNKIPRRISKKGPSRPLWVSSPAPMNIIPPFVDVESSTTSPSAAAVVKQQQQQPMPIVTDIVGISHFFDFIQSSSSSIVIPTTNNDSHDDDDYGDGGYKLCVVKYHTKNCKMCQRVDLKYRKLALQYGDVVVNTAPKENDDGDDDDELSLFRQKKRGPVRFANVEYSINRDLCQALHIPRFPYVEIYEDGMLVSSFATGPVFNFGVMVRDGIMTRLMAGEEEEAGRRAGLGLGEEVVEERRRLVEGLKREYWGKRFGE